ncbi:hypothetical protein [Microlunatus ginsengisoli]|uniref:hypothetical protein n=1 Tax=Microlunatus ginsengisoli TaxID=363863 RepID=UPI0031E19670
MIPIALILLAIVILFCVAVVVSNPVAVTLSVFGLEIPLQTPAVFFTGAATMLVTIVALWLLRVGVRRERARRKELKTLKKAAKADAKATAATSTAATGSTASGSTASGSTASGSSAARPPVDSGPVVPQQSATGQAGIPPAGARQTGDGPTTTAADREALLAEVDDATRDDPPR